MSWFKDRLKPSGIGSSIRRAFSEGRGDWSAVEDALISADVGAQLAHELIQAARGGKGQPETALREVLLERLNKFDSRALNFSNSPTVFILVGVNGAGKTTTAGKLAEKLVRSGKQVVLGAADTFRAAAAEQLETWANRTGAAIVRGAAQSDPASVAFEAVKQGVTNKADVIIIDSAGRLHTEQGLMDELSKLRRVVEKQQEVSEVLLVLDATTGQNGLQQAAVFTKAVSITGIVLTKLDGTAKGGIALAVEAKLAVPVKLVGLGESAADLAEFSPNEYVDALLA